MQQLLQIYVPSQFVISMTCTPYLGIVADCLVHDSPSERVRRPMITCCHFNGAVIVAQGYTDIHVSLSYKMIHYLKYLQENEIAV